MPACRTQRAGRSEAGAQRLTEQAAGSARLQELLKQAGPGVAIAPLIAKGF
jgi:hypothetical protein